MDHQHCDFLHRVADGRVELSDDHARHAGEGHDDDAHAVDGMVVVYYRDSWVAGVWSVALSGNSASVGSQHGHQFLCAAGGGERCADGAQRRIAAAMAASVLVLRTSRSLHCDSAGHGRDLADSLDVFAQADLWI